MKSSSSGSTIERSRTTPSRPGPRHGRDAAVEDQMALAEAAEGLITAMRNGDDTLAAGHARIIRATTDERAARCGTHPAAADGTYCRDCGI
ncbi:hypothetical protein CF326_g3192 [Tilletia indica]|nr:hypothetical protein CF326_g3192 [Tilletia indica]